MSVGPRGPYAKDPGGSTSMFIYVGPGDPYAKDPEGSTKIKIRVKPTVPVRQETQDVNKYTHSCHIFQQVGLRRKY